MSTYFVVSTFMEVPLISLDGLYMFIRENRIYKWMIQGYTVTPMSGNAHMSTTSLAGRDRLVWHAASASPYSPCDQDGSGRSQSLIQVWNILNLMCKHISSIESIQYSSCLVELDLRFNASLQYRAFLLSEHHSLYEFPCLRDNHFQSCQTFFKIQFTGRN